MQRLNFLQSDYWTFYRSNSVLCTYQWYTSPCIPGADVGEMREICRQNLPRGVGTKLGLPQMAYTFSFAMLNVFGKLFVNSTNTHISLSHTVHDREIWGICKEYVGGWYTGLYLRYGVFH